MGRNILSRRRMGATGRACRTGGPPVASPVPERVRGFLHRENEPLACSRGIRIAGVHDDQPSSAIATPHGYVAAISELLPRVRGSPAYDRVFTGGRADRPAIEDVRIGWLPVENARSVGDVRQIELPDLVEASDHVATVAYAYRVGSVERHPAIDPSSMCRDGKSAVRLHQRVFRGVTRGIAGVDGDCTRRRQRSQYQNGERSVHGSTLLLFDRGVKLPGSRAAPTSSSPGR